MELLNAKGQPWGEVDISAIFFSVREGTDPKAVFTALADIDPDFDIEESANDCRIDKGRYIEDYGPESDRKSTRLNSSH